MNNIDVSQIGLKAQTLYNTQQDDAVSRTESQCQRMIFPLTKQEESQNVMSMTESRTRKHKLFEPFQSDQRNTAKSHLPQERRNEENAKNVTKITFKIPDISEYYISQKLQTTTHRLNNVLRMHSLIHVKDLAMIQEQREQRKEKEKRETSPAPIETKSTRQQSKRKDSFKQQETAKQNNIFDKLQVSHTLLIYFIIGIAVCGFTFKMLFF